MKAQSCVAHATLLLSSTVDRSTGEDNIILFLKNKNLCMLLVLNKNSLAVKKVRDQSEATMAISDQKL